MFFTHLKQKLPRCTSAGGNLPLHLDSYLFPVMDIDPLLSGFAGEAAAVVEVESVDVECYTLCHIRDIIKKKAVLGRPCPFKKEWRSLIICCKGTSFIQYFQIFCKLFRGLYLFYVFGESPSISPRSLPSSVICRTVAKSSCELSFTPFITSKRFVIYTGIPLLLKHRPLQAVRMP